MAISMVQAKKKYVNRSSASKKKQQQQNIFNCILWAYTAVKKISHDFIFGALGTFQKSTTNFLTPV